MLLSWLYDSDDGDPLIKSGVEEKVFFHDISKGMDFEIPQKIAALRVAFVYIKLLATFF